MADKISSSNPKPAAVIRNASKTLESAVDLIYMPTDLEKRAKAEFWVKFSQGPARSTDKVTAASVAQVLGRTTMNKSWSLPGFKDWFLNKDEFRQGVEYLQMHALQTMRDLLHDDKSDIRHKAAKTILELGEKFSPKKPEVIVADAKIQKMTAEDLKDYLKDNKEAILALMDGDDD
jgi:hypothetical protein